MGHGAGRMAASCAVAWLPGCFCGEGNKAAARGIMSCRRRWAVEEAEVQRDSLNGRFPSKIGTATEDAVADRKQPAAWEENQPSIQWAVAVQEWLQWFALPVTG
jgi:hypothetical protein